MSSSQTSHSLAFRVMRLCRPTLHVDTPLLVDPSDLLVGEDIYDDPMAASHLPRLLGSLKFQPSGDAADLGYRNRFLLNDSTDSMGLSGLLLLPQAFGAIYLGETFCSYISINNSSNFEVRDITIKAEIQTEKQRILLLDTSKSAVESIRAGGRYDFIVEHDVKELGAHTLVCTAHYNDGDGERKHLPQFFKFNVANPLSVRTKVRVVKDTTFIEACIENHTKSNLYMDQVEFEPAQNWSAAKLKADEHSSDENSTARETFRPPVLIRSGGGIQNYLYQLKSSSQSSDQIKVEGNVLGKLQITWRTNLGEPGRLQTQQILGAVIARKEIDLQVVRLPTTISLGRSFSVHIDLLNLTERELGPFEVSLSPDDLPEERAITINGLQKMVLPKVEAFGSIDFHLNLVAMKLGVQKITGIRIYEYKEGKTYNPLPDMEVFVDLE
ncbi:hypothetical protein SAY87_008776 [Trapa incisa]|uniref:Trafficking protein particle complex subunit 13 n=1 Tax=Trapa incisa TaxID=236973 RepID=A0AAN7JWJ0_9MYRT|nr:hypothetical protein SAY87_008776 [Trapa incisa]